MVIYYLNLTHLFRLFNHMGGVFLPKMSFSFHSITQNEVEPPAPAVIGVLKASKVGYYSTCDETLNDFWRRELGHLF